MRLDVPPRGRADVEDRMGEAAQAEGMMGVAPVVAEEMIVMVVVKAAPAQKHAPIAVRVDVGIARTIGLSHIRRTLDWIGRRGFRLLTFG
jgi:uncharacterized membrane protein YjjP (DUF1212 family)